MTQLIPPTDEQPLAARMRPRTLDEFVGQGHIVGSGRLLRRAIEADQLSSIIVYGPPGTGKTTLAMVIARTTRAHFITINAVLGGVAEIRSAIRDAEKRRADAGQRTILFVDEVHRFNKAQQDALLPHVENGTVLLIGATTENPYFSVNRALTSRSRIFQLKSLENDDLRRLLDVALADRERGYGTRPVVMHDDAREHIVKVASGDGRALLNALELAVETTPPDKEGRVHVTLDVAEESIQQRAVLYDREGDYHYDTISAFIKSLRGSDPDAAMYWLAKMVYAGEDPRFIFRRMLIFASEDVGIADSQALAVTEAAAATFDRVGLPEGRFALGHAALYLATSPKSNSVFAFFDALSAVEQESKDDVPNHLKDNNRDAESFGHGAGYMYPHAYRDHWVAQQYLPEHMRGRVFYQPSPLGAEAPIRDTVHAHREAQLAAMAEVDSRPSPEVLTFTKVRTASDRWLLRTLSDVGDNLAKVRDRVLDAAAIARHDVVLDAHATSGLLTWGALRRAPEGGVWSVAADSTALQLLEDQVARLADLERPSFVLGPAARLAKGEFGAAGPEFARQRFDAVVAMRLLASTTEKEAVLRFCATRLAAHGRLCLAEPVGQLGQRLSALLDQDALPPDLYRALTAAETAVYGDRTHPALDFTEESIQVLLASIPELASVTLKSEVLTEDVRVSDALITKWFVAKSIDPSRIAVELVGRLGTEGVDALVAKYRAALLGKTVPWRSVMLFIGAERAG